VPKKAVAIFFIAAFIGAAIFIYFTFPRTKEEIPQSNNQRPFPSSPEPGGVPVPETVPHPNTPQPPRGPTLRVMGWASPAEAKTLETQADAFASATGNRASLTIESNVGDYRRDLKDALASDTPPDVCMVSARDFSGADPVRDLVEVTPNPESVTRSVDAFTVTGQVCAVPDEFSVEVLFYNPEHFDRAGIGYPDRHWNWDIMEAMSRALASLKLKNASGDPIYPLELPADFDFWNILCTQAGHPALDLDVWHLADAESKESHLRALDFIHEIYHDLVVTAPMPKANEKPGRFFAQQQASLLIAPSDLVASLPKFHYVMTVLPSDITRASLAQVNGWAVTAKSPQPDAARILASFLARQPVHAGWSSVQKPTDDNSPDAVCYEALEQALLPRIEPKAAPLAQLLDQQIGSLARNAQQTPDNLYAQIQTEYQNSAVPIAVESSLPHAVGVKPSVKADAGAQLRGW